MCLCNGFDEGQSITRVTDLMRVCLVQFESRDMDRCSGLRVACSSIDGRVSCCPLIAEIG
jgi:hypothetical protein